MTIYLGIDPGKKGALALLDTDPMSVTVHDMPGTTTELHDLLCTLPVVKKCVLEKLYPSQVMSRVSISRMFSDFGVLRGALQWCNIPTVEVTPAKWKAAMDLSSDKNASRQMAMQRFPHQDDLFKRVKDDGRAEAALLACYGAGK